MELERRTLGAEAGPGDPALRECKQIPCPPAGNYATVSGPETVTAVKTASSRRLPARKSAHIGPCPLPPRPIDKFTTTGESYEHGLHRSLRRRRRPNAVGLLYAHLSLTYRNGRTQT